MYMYTYMYIINTWSLQVHVHVHIHVYEPQHIVHEHVMSLHILHVQLHVNAVT